LTSTNLSGILYIRTYYQDKNRRLAIDTCVRVVELFCGIAGFRFGLERASPKFKIVWANELDRYACQIYRKNFGEGELYEGDITKVDAGSIPDHDLLCAGFPCQAFSIAGKRLGFKDTRGTLFFEIARIAKAKQPMYMLLENVKGILSHQNGKTLEIILDNLQELGYYVNYDLYNSKNFGVPQNRERIFFICKHIRLLSSVGQNEKITSCETIIQEWLFQLLLNNLKEVQKLQEHALKDWVIGYLLCQEISRNQKSSEKNILDGIIIPMESSLFQLKTEEVWQNIDTWLKNQWEENYLSQTKFTTSTAIKEIIDWRTYTYSQMFLVILTATAHLRNLQKNLWKEILSTLIIYKEVTKYARINDKIKEAVITETDIMHIPTNHKHSPESFIVGHSRGPRRPEVFPIGEADSIHSEKVANCLDANYHKGWLDHGQRTMIKETQKLPDAQRVREIDGLSITLKGEGGGQGAKTGLYAIPVLTPDRVKKRQNGRRFKEDGDPSFTLTGQDKHGIYDGVKIRRLTPTECERLQGFPDGWTATGYSKNESNAIKKEGGLVISDTQRYKCLGNAVTTNVITAIGKRLLDANKI